MPARLARRRIDHHPLYISLLVALVVDAIIILTHVTIAGTAHARLSTGASDVMAIVMGSSAIACLLAAASGTRRWRPRADLRDTYAIQAWGLLPVIISMGVFAIGILLTVPWIDNLETVVLIAGAMVGLACTAWGFRTQAHRLTQELRRDVHAEEGRTR